MCLLPNRDKLKERAADSMTSPDFIALTSLESGDGEYLALEARISDASSPIKLALQTSKDGESLLYQLTKGDDVYGGKVELIVNGDRVLAGVCLSKVNDRRVFKQVDKKGKAKMACRAHGNITYLTKDDVDVVNYWVPTIINHLAQNVNHFLTAIVNEGSGRATGNSSDNDYSLDHDQSDNRNSPRSHFRRAYTKDKTVLNDAGEEVVLTVGVTGTFVKPDWSSYSTDDVVADVTAVANQISSLHFERRILPDIAAAGHPRRDVLDAYHSARN